MADARLPEFVHIAAGGPSWAHGDTVGPLRLSVTPVTVAQYTWYVREVCATLPRSVVADGFGSPPQFSGALPDGGVIEDSALLSHPVTGVSWREAGDYCVWLSGRLGLRCRLPTAHEWRWSAGGPGEYRWSLGNTFDRAVYAPEAVRSRPVASSPPNGFGLYDMTGNVFEWCSDPAPGGDSASISRVIKGGAFTVRNPESFENSTFFTADELSVVPYIGFRVAVDPRGAHEESRTHG